MADENASNWQDVAVREFMGVGTDQFSQFLENIREIRLGIESIQENTAGSLAADNKLVEFYTKEGGTSPISSRPPNAIMQGNVPSAWITGAGQGANLSVPGLMQQTVQEAISGSSSKSTGASHPSVPDSNPLRTLRDRENPVSAMSGLSSFEVPGLFGGQWTMQAGMQVASQGLAQLAAKGFGGWASGPDGPLPAQDQSWLRQKTWGAAQAAEAGYQDWAPAMSGIHSLSRQALQTGEQYTSYGELLGVAPGSSSSGFIGQEIGPVRLPTGATLKGVEAGVSDWFQGAISPGITREQIGMIRQNLAGVGWYGDAAEGMNDTLRRVTQFSPQIGTSPLTAQMLDKSVRYGNTSLAQLEKTLKNIPAAANAAHVSFEQMQADMDAFGEFNQSRGGTYAAGTQLAQTASSVSGLPASSMMGLLSSPYTQGWTMTQTGVAPWAQGSLSPEAQMAYGMQGFGFASTMVDGLQGQSYKIPGTGFTDRVSAVENQASYLQALGMYPDMSPEVLQKLLRDPKKTKALQAGYGLEGAARVYSEDIGQAANKVGKSATPENLAQLKAAQGKVRQLRKTAAKAINPQTGKTMFTPDELDEIFAAKQGGALNYLNENTDYKATLISDLEDAGNSTLAEKLKGQPVPGKWGAGHSTLSSSDFTQGELAEIKAMTAKSRGSAVFNTLKEKVAEKTSESSSADDGEGNTVVELGPMAAQYFQLLSPTGAAKSAAGASSGVPLNTPFGSGPTRP